MNKNDRYKLYSESVGPGWWGILDKYIPQILAIDPEAELYIKEKFGVLRLSARSKPDKIEQFMAIEAAAELESSTVCECCGSRGKLRTKREWMQTLCIRCNLIKRDRIIEHTAKKWLKAANKNENNLL